MNGARLAGVERSSQTNISTNTLILTIGEEACELLHSRRFWEEAYCSQDAYLNNLSNTSVEYTLTSSCFSLSALSWLQMEHLNFKAKEK